MNDLPISVDRILVVLGVVQVVCTVLSLVLPADWTVTKVCARLAVTLPSRWNITPTPKGPPTPPTLPLLGVLVVTLGFALVGCAGSFEEMRLVAKAPIPQTKIVITGSDDRAYCRGLDSSRSTWNTIAIAFDTAGGSTALGAVVTAVERERVGGPEAAIGLAVAGGVLTLGGVVAHARANDIASTWVRECSQ